MRERLRRWWRDVRALARGRFLAVEGARLPTGFGVAWMDLDYRAAVVLPMPLNLVAGALDCVRRRVKRGLWDERCANAYDAGFQAGVDAKTSLDEDLLRRVHALQARVRELSEGRR